MRPLRALAVVLALFLLPLAGGCAGYRLVRPGDLHAPNYEPRPVAIPARCDTLISQAAARELSGVGEAELRLVSFCQQQQLVRAAEEEAVARKLEAHAEVASFALRLTVVTVGALIAVLTWIF